MGEYTPTGFAASLGKQLQIVIISFKSWGFYFSCVWGGILEIIRIINACFKITCYLILFF